MSQDEKKLYEQQERKILEQSEAFIALLTKRGILADPAIDDKKVRSAKQERKKNSYHNTLMLLQHYRTIAWMLECFPETLIQELERPLADLDALLEQVDVEYAMENRKLEGRMAGVQKSRLLLDRINEALTVLKKKPENGERLYQLIYLTYIDPEQLSHTELLYRLDMSSRHYYRLRQQAITIISLRLWATPAPDMDLWLEMLALLEGLG